MQKRAIKEVGIWSRFNLRRLRLNTVKNVNSLQTDDDDYYYYYVASVVSDSVRPHRQLPTRLPRPWDSPDKNTGVGCHFLLQHMQVESESEVAQLCPTSSDPMDCSLPGPPSMGFSRQEYWSGVPLPSPGSTSVLF